MCREDEVRDGIVRTARLGLDDDGLPVLALLLRDESGDIVAYRNLCRHLPVPLDGGTGELLSEDGAQSFLKQCPHAEYVNVKNAAHMVAGDRNDIFAGSVIEFLTRTAPPRQCPDREIQAVEFND